MLLYLLSAEDLGLTPSSAWDTRFDKAAVRRTVDFYLARTSHGSTLSRPVVLVAAGPGRPGPVLVIVHRGARQRSRRHPGRTTGGASIWRMAGTVDLLLRCYTGLETRDEMLWLHPALPPELGRVRLQMVYRSHNIELNLTPTALMLRLQARSVPPIRCGSTLSRPPCTPGTPITSI